MIKECLIITLHQASASDLICFFPDSHAPDKHLMSSLCMTVHMLNVGVLYLNLKEKTAYFTLTHIKLSPSVLAFGKQLMCVITYLNVLLSSL